MKAAISKRRYSLVPNSKFLLTSEVIAQPRQDQSDMLSKNSTHGKPLFNCAKFKKRSAVSFGGLEKSVSLPWQALQCTTYRAL